MRSLWVGVVLALAGACAGGNSLETTGAFSTLSPVTGDSNTGGSDDDSTSTTGMDTTGEAIGDDGPTTGGTETSTASDSSSSGSADGSSSTSGEELPPQPATGWWSHCTTDAQCTDGLICFANGTMTDGVCMSSCSPVANPSSCGAPPLGSTATTMCVNNGKQSLCALDCSGSKSCPAGMLCLEGTDDAGPIEICL